MRSRFENDDCDSRNSVKVARVLLMINIQMRIGICDDSR